MSALIFVSLLLVIITDATEVNGAVTAGTTNIVESLDKDPFGDQKIDGKFVASFNLPIFIYS